MYGGTKGIIVQNNVKGQSLLHVLPLPMGLTTFLLVALEGVAQVPLGKAEKWCMIDGT